MSCTSGQPATPTVGVPSVTIVGQGLANTSVGASLTRFAGPISGPAFVATEPEAQFIMPIGGVLTNLYVATSTAQPASGSMVITVRKNGAGTALAITLAASATSGVASNTTARVTVAAGDLVSVRFLNNATDFSAQVLSFSFQLMI